MKRELKITGSAGKSARSIARVLQENGYEAVITGGAVRDLLLNLKPKDYDIATNARPEQVLKIFKKTQKVGVAFGVILVHDFSRAIEVATFRTDGEYSDGRRPDSVEFTDARTDASRRDFTMNGLFYDIEQQEVLDYVGGIEDLQNSLLRAIGNAEKRFQEDYLRMLRAIRFAVTYHFSIEKETWAALKNNADKIVSIAPERIHAELQMIFSKGNSDAAMELLKESGLQAALFSESVCIKPGREHLISKEGGDLSAVLTLLFSSANLSLLEKVLEGLRCTNQERKEIFEMHKKLSAFEKYLTLSPGQRKRVLRKFEKERCLFILGRLPVANAVLQAVEKDYAAWDDSKLNPEQILTGDDLLKAGLKPGPLLGKCLKFLETMTLEEKVESADEAWQALKSHPELGENFK